MSILRVARLGHPVLRMVADPVDPTDIPGDDVQRLIADMLETVDAYDGAGLAAPQVHVSRRVVVLHLGDEAGMRVWINPVVTPLTDEMVVTMEGCLSVPGLRGAVARPAAVEVQALDEHGAPVRLHLRGFAAVVAQHECDHLDGVLYVDRVDPRTLAFLEEYRRFGAFPWGADEDTDPAAPPDPPAEGEEHLLDDDALESWAESVSDQDTN